MQLIKSIMPEELIMHDYNWKRTPGYINVYINNEGVIKLLNSKNELIDPFVQKWKTTKGTYLYVRVINDDFVPVNKAIHQLVCLTYHGYPPSDGRTYEPNHIDGDKHNNRPSNLEWLTRSSNVQHAVDNGLCSYGIRIEATNHITGKVKKYNSLSSMSREWGIERYKLKSLLYQYQNSLYQGEWSFKIDDSSDKLIKRHQRRTVVCKDYVQNKIYIFQDAEAAAVYTGVQAGSIIYRLNKNKADAIYDQLLSRYIFRTTDDSNEWPEFTKFQAEESEIKYIDNANKVRKSRK